VETLPASIKGCEECLKDPQPLDSPANVHELREDRLLRLDSQPSRFPARSQGWPPDRVSAEQGEDWSWCYVDEAASAWSAR
jgi:hypothetical protein